jgi:hypothetical protein
MATTFRTNKRIAFHMNKPQLPVKRGIGPSTEAKTTILSKKPPTRITGVRG